jgi:dual specificity protein phosphatase-like protein
MPASRKRTNPPPKLAAKNGVSEIAPNVYVGGWKDAVAFEGTRFCVLDDAPDDMPPATHVRIYDEATDRAIRPNLDRLAEAIGKARAKGDAVLVFCGHGVRRSPLVGAWYLHRSENLTLDEAYDRIQAVRPKVERASEWLGDTQDLTGSR